MDLVNAIGMPVSYTIGLDPSGRERLVVVVKGTFLIPEAGGEAPLAAEQAPFVMADTFSGEPGLSAVVHETDFAPVKPQCDVLLLGSAYAQDGKPTRKVTVGLRVGALKKGFEVLGNRYWKLGALGDLGPSDPEPFVKQPISYDVAYGGSELDVKTKALVSAYARNPVGCGYLPKSTGSNIFGKPVPSTQEIGKPISSTKGSYAPMAFGPIGRNFEERTRYAGTYDDKWFEENFPFLPPNFDNRYFQAAPADQQLPYLAGGEVVQLHNLTPKHLPPFTLPTIAVPIECTNAKRERVEQQAVIDTLVLEPDRGQLTLTWRSSFPLRRNIHEVIQLVIGRMPPGWYRARLLGKTYYPSLGRLTTAKEAD